MTRLTVNSMAEITLCVNYNPQIQIFAESKTKRSKIEVSNKTKRSKNQQAHTTKNATRKRLHFWFSTGISVQSLFLGDASEYPFPCLAPYRLVARHVPRQLPQVGQQGVSLRYGLQTQPVVVIVVIDHRRIRAPV